MALAARVEVTAYRFGVVFTLRCHFLQVLVGANIWPPQDMLPNGLMKVNRNKTAYARAQLRDRQCQWNCCHWEVWWLEKASLPGPGLRRIGFVAASPTVDHTTSCCLFHCSQSKTTALEDEVPLLESLQHDQTYTREQEIPHFPEETGL